MSQISHAFAVALIFEVAGERDVALYCAEHAITLSPVRFVHYDSIGELVSLAGEVFSIQAVKETAVTQLRML